MTPQQVNQVQTSFNKIIPIADPAAALFYGRLFAIAPETRALFRGDMHRQGRKLMSAIATVVSGLGDFEAIVPVACDLAKRHVSYGVTSEHYALVAIGARVGERPFSICGRPLRGKRKLQDCRGA
jgi:nitric oxide dioxygenase